MKKTHIPKTPGAFTLYVIRSHKLLIGAVILFVVATEVVAAFGPVILGRIIDMATIYMGTPDTSGEITLKTIGFFVILYPLARLTVSISIRGTGYTLHYLTSYMRTGAYRTLFEHLSLHGRTYFTNRFAGAVSSDVNIVGQNMVRMTRFFTYSGLALFITIITTFFIIVTANLTLAVVFMVGIIILVPLNYLLSRKTIHLSKEAVKTLSALRGNIVDSITNINAVQQFAMRNRELARLDISIVKHQKADIAADVYGETALLINNILVMCFIGGLMFGAFLFWKDGLITLGQFVVVLTLTATVVRGLSHVGNSINELASLYGETHHTLQEILQEHEIVDKEDAQQLVVMKGEIKFNDVTFTYHEGSAVFENLSLVIKPGERVGIVGPSGGGKTTLVKLLLRQHDVDGGSITIDDMVISDVTQESVRRAIGVVPQEPILFHRTLFENIAYGKDNATYEEVVVAAKQALIHDFIETLPNGYDTLTGERGIKLSGGQKQRVAIARAILKAAPILILDEATSSLDSESEVYVQQGLHELMRGKTVIAIAHRLSTLKEMDRIIVFQDGKVAQDGSHDALLREEGGVYARLWSHQAGGYIKDEHSAH